jgi:hypothetical protein
VPDAGVVEAGDEGSASTMTSPTAFFDAGSDVVLGALAEGVLPAADAAQPVQSSAWCSIRLSAVDDLEANAVTCVVGDTEAFGNFGQLGCVDELMRPSRLRACSS